MQLTPGPERGPPNNEFIKIRSSESGSLITSQSSFSIVSLYSGDFKSACFFASFMLLMQISKSMHTVSYMTTGLGPLTSCTFLKPPNEDSNFTVRIYCIYAQKRSLGSPQNTPQNMQNLKSPASTPSTICIMGPNLYLPWAPNTLNGPVYSHHLETVFYNLLMMQKRYREIRIVVHSS